jgi:hypothetical protein
VAARCPDRAGWPARARTGNVAGRDGVSGFILLFLAMLQAANIGFEPNGVFA